MDKETLYTIALTQVRGIGPVTARRIYDKAGSATAIFENLRHLPDVLPDATPRIISLLQTAADAPLRRAEQELERIAHKAVQCLTIQQHNYPLRLRECNDAPLVIYFCGNADLNRQHIISMVGTRKCTPYGRDICHQFISELKDYDPDILIVSGLAYGIDICSHREALANGMDTVAVLAHGLDQIYPSMHRKIAVEMTRHGGLLTEHVTGTTPEKENFVQRNRIVAGLSDVTIVVESAEKGGSLITANMAHSYQREVLAFPGRIYDECSKGCNRIIQNEMAHPLRSAEDLFNMMNWKRKGVEGAAVQGELFVRMTEDERRIVGCMQGVEEKSVGTLVSETGMAYSAISVVMFELESKGVVEYVSGNRYRLVRPLGNGVSV